MSKGPQPTSSRRKFMIGGATGLGVALAGCLGGSDSSNGNTLNWGGSVPVQSLDPHRETAAASWRVFENITEGLTKVNWDYELEPHLASDWTISESGTDLSFTLREGVTFHNGNEMTSSDVMATFNRIANGEYLATGYFDFVDSMTAPDDYTFEMTLTEPFAPLLARMSTNSMHILPESQANQDEVSEPIGTGPFQFESREVETEFVMTKHGDYWQSDYPNFDRVVKQEITDGETRLNRLRTGEVDFINDVPAQQIEQVSENSELRWEERYPKIFYYLGLNCGTEPFNDLDARIALEHTFDRKEIIEAALYGYGIVPNSPSYPDSRWEHPDLEPRGKDLDAAEEHLSQSAYADGFDTTIKIPEAYGPAQPAATLISEGAAEIGINIDIQQITWSTWLSDVFDQQNFEATISTNLGLWYPDFGYYKIQHPDGAFYFTNWENEEYQSTVEAARQTYDAEERAAMYHEAAEILKEDRSGRVPLFWGGYQLAAKNNYEGEMGAPDGSTLRLWDNDLA